MKNQIYQQLVQLATSILKEDNLSILEVKNIAQQLYEQATILAYAETEKGTTSTTLVDGSQSFKITNKTVIENSTTIIDEQILKEFSKSENPIVELKDNKKTKASDQKEVFNEPKPIQEAPALLHELENLTQGFDLPDFEPLHKIEKDKNIPIVNNPIEVVEKPLKSLSINETLGKGLSIGLNDRLAFINQLFGGNQEDYTRVISQLNTTQTLAEAQQFINEIIKPEYNNWEGKETFELRFFQLLERNFQL